MRAAAAAAVAVVVVPEMDQRLEADTEAAPAEAALAVSFGRRAPAAADSPLECLAGSFVPVDASPGRWARDTCTREEEEEEEEREGAADVMGQRAAALAFVVGAVRDTPRQREVGGEQGSRGRRGTVESETVALEGIPAFSAADPAAAVGLDQEHREGSVAADTAGPSWEARSPVHRLDSP